MNFRILLYWLIVSVPLSWGVAQSVNAALPLFGAKPMSHFLGMPAIPAAPAAPSPTPSPTAAPVAVPSSTP